MKLSIITININNADDLRKTIESIVSQTFTDYEYIVIDGASTDGSVDVIKQYEDKITYWVSEPDKGIYNAMNKGITKAKGEYCLFLNSGDWLDERALEYFDSYVQDNPFDIITGDIIVFKNGTNKKIILPEAITAKQLVINYLPHQSTFIKRSLFSELGLYNENNRISSDREFFIKAILLNNKSWGHLNKNIAFFDGNGISSINQKEVDEENWRIAFERLPMFAPDYMELFEKSLEIDKLKKMIKKPVFRWAEVLDNSWFFSLVRKAKKLKG